MKRMLISFVRHEGAAFALAERVKGKVVLMGGEFQPWQDSPFKPQAMGVTLQDQSVVLEAFKRIANGKAHPISLILPDQWVRTLVFPVEDFPSKQKEALELLRWKLKKMLPLDPDVLRLRYHPLPEDIRGVTRVMVHIGLESLLSFFEEGLGAFKLKVGRISTPFWVLKALPEPQDGWGLLTLEPSLWTLGLFHKEQLLLFRQRFFTPQEIKGVLEEIDRSFTYFKRRWSLEVHHLYLWSAYPDLMDGVTQAIPLLATPLEKEPQIPELPNPIQTLLWGASSYDL